jgi:hypothetical protein
VTAPYEPMKRSGADKAWPPDDSWTIGELAAWLSFWRSYAALRAYARSTDPGLRITPHIQRLPPTAIPQQRPSADPRWDDLKRRGLHAHAKRQRQRGHL